MCSNRRSESSWRRRCVERRAEKGRGLIEQLEPRTGFSRVRPFAAVVVLPAFLAFCSRHYTSPTGVCPAVQKDAIILTVRDARTGLPAAKGALVTAVHKLPEGTVVNESGTVNDTLGLTVRIGGTPGTYAITVQRTGYVTWTSSSINVLAEPAATCLPETVNLTASLRPAGA